MQSLEQNPQHNSKRIHLERKAFNCWLDAENTMWHQRSRYLWIADGDRNTSFFHQKASNRKEKNSILGITDENGFGKKMIWPWNELYWITLLPFFVQMALQTRLQ